MFHVMYEDYYVDSNYENEFSPYYKGTMYVTQEGLVFDWNTESQVYQYGFKIFQFEWEDVVLWAFSVNEYNEDGWGKGMEEYIERELVNLGYGECLSELTINSPDSEEFAIRDIRTRDFAVLFVGEECFTGNSHAEALGILDSNKRESVIEQEGEGVIVGHYCSSGTFYVDRVGKTIELYLPVSSDYIAVDTSDTESMSVDVYKRISRWYPDMPIFYGGF